MNKFWDIVKKTLGALMIIAVVYMQYQGRELGAIWLIVPSVLMGLNTDRIIEYLIKKKG